MSPRIVKNKLLPFGKNYAAINLFGVIFIKRHCPVTPVLVNHESIHTAQMKEMLYIPFYVAYLVEWLIRMVHTRGDSFKAYHTILCEREAYAHQYDLDYLKRRKRFAQWRGGWNPES